MSSAVFSKDVKANPNDGTIAYGQSGAKVSEIQKRLIELRYLSGVVNEKFDDATLEALHLYQKTAGLEETDKLTADQVEALKADTAPKSPDYDVLKYGFSGEDVAKLQHNLSTLGYYDGQNSGTFSRALEQAVKSFQKDQGLSQTGIVDEKTAELIKTEAQRETAKVADELILKTADITDNALASIDAATPVSEVTINTQNTSDLLRTGVILGAVVIFAIFLALVFVIELRRRKLAAVVERESDKKFRRKF